MKMFLNIYNILCWFLILKLTNSTELTEKLTSSLENILQFSIKNDHIIDINLLFGTAIVSGNNFCNYLATLFRFLLDFFFNQ